MMSFHNGLQTLIDALGRDLDGHIFTGATIRSIRRQESGFAIDFDTGDQIVHLIVSALLFTLPAYAYPALPFDFPVSFLDILSRIYYPPVAVVYLGYIARPPGIRMDGFGFLTPEKENRRILGALWGSSIFPGRAPEQGCALTVFVGGSRQPENAGLCDDTLVDLVRSDLKDLMGLGHRPDLVVVKKWEKAIPQYRIGHRKIMTCIDEFEENCPGVFISGNFRGGISVADCVKQGRAMSDRVIAYLSEK
jgi:oxygen-dependent protoporphyrinogen oxidase